MQNQNTLTPYIYIIITASTLTLLLMVLIHADVDWSLAWIFSGFLLYIPLLFTENRVWRGLVIAGEYLFLLFIFWVFMMLAKYKPGEELVPLVLFIIHSFIRLFLFFKVLGSRYPLSLAIAITLLISIPVYGYGTTEYFKLM
ncbi:hypothetical protein [Sinomicrobium weinanense]|uniref:Uncharacterized protein n=1 Tax=Sinomicrobium weinanense TaxID=2842200 RepID=A0A926JVX2_9FLAO|nr:hypothetical protein [Sinomicrobium weinanense]MBC9798570.1 hypothetical protein [Sinomicrobium weinanense]MBU3126022.1 hypothetical protein [Sinomicrobium weinanense]